MKPLNELEGAPGNADHAGEAKVGKLSKSKALLIALAAIAILLILGAIL